jgi:hypothetical protein
MVEGQAQVVLLVRAFEEADRDGVVLSLYDRAAATRRALRVTGLARWPQDLRDAESPRYGETVARRARVLFDALRRRIPALSGLIRVARLGATTGPTLIVAGFLVGLASTALGPAREGRTLSPPMVAIVGWNLAAYALLLLGLVAPSFRRVRRFAPWLAERLLRGALWRRLRGFGGVAAETGEREGVTASALLRFSGMWLRVAGGLLAARLRRTLHLAAIALAFGAVGGVYVLGSGVATRAHALAALVVVVLPRVVLALVECWRCHVRFEIPIDLRETYYRRVFTEWRGATRRVEVVSYSYAPAPATLAALEELLREHFGARAEIHAPAPLAHGTDASCVAGVRRPRLGAWERAVSPIEDLTDPERETCHVVLFNAGQRPEPDVHRPFLEDLQTRLAPSDGRLLVVVDGSPLLERGLEPEPRRERFRDWASLARAAGLTAIDFDPSRPLDDEFVAEVGAAVWRCAERESAPGTGRPRAHAATSGA